MLTNISNYFQKTSADVTDLSSFHKIIILYLKTTFKKISHTHTKIRGYEKLDEQNFLYDLDQQMIKRKFYKEKSMWERFSNTFIAIVNEHAPLKEKVVKGNNATFMTKELRKTIMNRSRLKRKYQVGSSRESFKNLKKKKTEK